MNTCFKNISRYCQAAKLSFAETFWPTRCAICDTPGVSLCQNCVRKLCFIDYWQACPQCGSPYGLIQCCDCNNAIMEMLGRTSPAYDTCVSAVEFDDYSASIIRSWKDAGQRSLAYDMASIMTPYVLPTWLNAKPTIIPIPASTTAKKIRGFDHGLELATEMGILLNMPVLEVLHAPKNKDQRVLGRHDRLANMNNRFTINQHVCTLPHSVILTDDVHTTGATLYAAADALHDAGITNVWALTFARV